MCCHISIVYLCQHTDYVLLEDCRLPDSSLNISRYQTNPPQFSTTCRASYADEQHQRLVYPCRNCQILQKDEQDRLQHGRPSRRFRNFYGRGNGRANESGWKDRNKYFVGPGTRNYQNPRRGNYEYDGQKQWPKTSAPSRNLKTTARTSTTTTTTTARPTARTATTTRRQPIQRPESQETIEARARAAAAEYWCYRSPIRQSILPQSLPYVRTGLEPASSLAIASFGEYVAQILARARASAGAGRDQPLNPLASAFIPQRPEYHLARQAYQRHH